MRRHRHATGGQRGADRAPEVELAALASVLFNYVFAMLWMTEYGERDGMKRYLADFDGVDRSAPPEPDKKKK